MTVQIKITTKQWTAIDRLISTAANLLESSDDQHFQKKMAKDLKAFKSVEKKYYQKTRMLK